MPFGDNTRAGPRRRKQQRRASGRLKRQDDPLADQPRVFGTGLCRHRPQRIQPMESSWKRKRINQNPHLSPTRHPHIDLNACKLKYTGLARNKFPTLKGSRMRSIGPNEITFELQKIQMMRFTFIKLKN